MPKLNMAATNVIKLDRDFDIKLVYLPEIFRQAQITIVPIIVRSIIDNGLGTFVNKADYRCFFK